MTTQAAATVEATPFSHSFSDDPNASARAVFKRSGNHFTMPFADILKVKLAQDVTEGPASYFFRKVDEDRAQEIAASMREHGVFDDKWPTFHWYKGELHGAKGNHRLRALHIIAEAGGLEGLDTVKFFIDDKNKTPEDVMAEVLLDNNGANLTYQDKAELVYRLYKIMKSAGKVAKKLAMTEQAVSQLLEYHTQVPEEAKEIVNSGQMAGSSVLTIYREAGRDKEVTKERLDAALAVAMERAKAKNPNVDAKKVRVTEKHVKEAVKRSNPKREAVHLDLQQFANGDVSPAQECIDELAEVTRRAIALLKEIGQGNSDTESMVFEMEGVLERAGRKGFVSRRG